MCWTAVLSVTPVEAARVMRRDDGAEPSIYADFREHAAGRCRAYAAGAFRLL